MSLQVTRQIESDYEPVDLTDWSTYPLPVALAASIPTEKTVFRGIPFRVGRRCEAGVHVVGFGADFAMDSVRIPLAGLAHHVIVAHAMAGFVMQPMPLGLVCARYVIRWEDGREVDLAVRERFEIAPAPTALGHRPALALPEADDHLLPRYAGKWNIAGRRLTQAVEGWPRALYLWPWRNPRPDIPLESLTVHPAGPTFYIGGVTLGRVDEPPFPKRAKSTVVIDVECPCRRAHADGAATQSGGGDVFDAMMPFARKPVLLDVTVDRGSTTYPYRLPDSDPERLSDSLLPGWGEPEPVGCGPAYVEIAATPSATVSVSHDGQELGSVGWAELRQAKEVDIGGGVRVRILDEPRNWVKTRVVDADTGLPLPCRIHFRSAHGVPFQPQGHHNHVADDLDSWNFGVGGDVRLGHTSYGYIDGECEGWLPRGRVLVDAAHGFEYEPIREWMTIEPEQRLLELRLKRAIRLDERHFSGDTHVHFLSTQAAHLEAAGEGLNVVNLLLAQWGHLFTSAEEFTGEPSVSHNGETIVYGCQENRQPMLGHLTLLGLKRPVSPWASDRVGPAELGSSLETTMARWADDCHAQGGTVIVPHFPLPSTWEYAALIATGRADAIELVMRNLDGHDEYYRYLNAGYPLPLVGGTDKMDADTPVGLYRTYVNIPDDEPFDYDTWCRYLRSGRTFLSGGPLLQFSVEGHGSGLTVTLPPGGGTVGVHAKAESVIPFSCLELVVNGEVVARTESSRPTRRLELREELRVSEHSWVAARCGGQDYYEGSLHHDAWRRGVMAHTSPVYVAVGGAWEMFDAGTADHMTTLLDAGIQYIRERTLQWPPEQVLHQHEHPDHLAFLEEPFHEALAAVRKTLEAHGGEGRRGC